MERASSTQILKAEHQVILKVIRALDAIIQDMRAGGAAPTDRIRTIVQFSRLFVDRCHHGKEEACLFPCLERRGVPREGGPIGVMLAEHEEGRRLVRTISDLVDAYADARDRHQLMALCAGYVGLLSGHIAKEDGVLFAMAEHVLADADEAEILRGYTAVDASEGGPAAREALMHLTDEVAGQRS
ncbi:MAG: hemerythrin domain-containing protein [Armatimonadetes bacterium]|nr:hemerythrin domain-containing protein [Armatimonadota bacterium]